MLRVRAFFSLLEIRTTFARARRFICEYFPAYSFYGPCTVASGSPPRMISGSRPLFLPLFYGTQALQQGGSKTAEFISPLRYQNSPKNRASVKAIGKERGKGDIRKKNTPAGNPPRGIRPPSWSKKGMRGRNAAPGRNSPQRNPTVKSARKNPIGALRRETQSKIEFLIHFRSCVFCSVPFSLGQTPFLGNQNSHFAFSVFCV